MYKKAVSIVFLTFFCLTESRAENLITHIIPDPEGRESHYNSMVKNLEEALDYSGKTPKVKPGHRVIFIGDIADHGAYGPDGFIFANALKNSSPESVILLRGNRENFFDILGKLDHRHYDNHPEKGIGVFLEGEIEKSRKTGNESFAVNRMVQLYQRYYGKSPATLESLKSALNSAAGKPISDFLAVARGDKALQLDFINARSRGSVKGFEFDSQSLARRSPDSTDVNERASATRTLADFENSLKPGGYRYKYSVGSQMANFDVSTGVLHIHSALSPELFGKTPYGESMRGPDGKVDVENMVAQQNIVNRALAINAAAGDADSILTLRENTRNRTSATYSNFGDYEVGTNSAKPSLPSLAHSQDLVNSGIKVISTGHKPVGDTSLIMVDPATGLAVMIHDTSYHSLGLMPKVTETGGEFTVKSFLNGKYVGAADGQIIEVEYKFDPKNPHKYNYGKANSLGNCVGRYTLDGKTNYLFAKEGEGQKTEYHSVEESIVADANSGKIKNRPELMFYGANDPALPRMKNTKEAEARAEDYRRMTSHYKRTKLVQALRASLPKIRLDSLSGYLNSEIEKAAEQSEEEIRKVQDLVLEESDPIKKEALREKERTINSQREFLFVNHLRQLTLNNKEIKSYPKTERVLAAILAEYPPNGSADTRNPEKKLSDRSIIEAHNIKAIVASLNKAGGSISQAEINIFLKQFSSHLDPELRDLVAAETRRIILENSGIARSLASSKPNSFDAFEAYENLVKIQGSRKLNKLVEQSLGFTEILAQQYVTRANKNGSFRGLSDLSTHETRDRMENIQKQIQIEIENIKVQREKISPKGKVAHFDEGKMQRLDEELRNWEKFQKTQLGLMKNLATAENYDQILEAAQKRGRGKRIVRLNKFDPNRVVNDTHTDSSDHSVNRSRSSKAGAVLGVGAAVLIPALLSRDNPGNLDNSASVEQAVEPVTVKEGK